MSLRLVLLLAAFLFFLIAAVDARLPRINALAMGLALWMLALLIAQ